MNKAQTAGIDLSKIAVRKLSLHYSQRTLAESAIVGWNPTPPNVHADIDSRDYQDSCQNRQVNNPSLRSLRHLYVMFAPRFRPKTVLQHGPGGFRSP